MEEPKVTNAQLDLMRHAVGMTSPGKLPFRNYFFAEKGHEDFDNLMQLVNMGLMKTGKSRLSDDTLFCLTDQGCWMLGISGTDAIPA